MDLCDLVVLFVFSTLLRTSSRADAEVFCVFMESCILPCSFPTGEDLALQWVLVQGNLPVHSYYNNQDQLARQDQRFRKRTSLFNDQISRGNASLQLTGVTVQDQGRYKCYTGTRAGPEESFITLSLNAPVRKVHIQQVENRITCSSEGVYPKPNLTWTTSPRSNRALQNQTTVQQTEQQLYSISSSLEDPAPDLDYSCTVRTQMNQRRATWFRPIPINSSGSGTTISCRSSKSPPTGLIWRFNHSQIILNRTGTDVTVSEAWRQHVRTGPESDLMLKDLSPKQEGVYTCELSDADETFVSSTVLRLEESPDSYINAASIAGWVVGAVLFLVLIAAAIVYITHKMITLNQQSGDTRGHYTPPQVETSKEEEKDPLNRSNMKDVNNVTPAAPFVD